MARNLKNPLRLAGGTLPNRAEVRSGARIVIFAGILVACFPIAKAKDDSVRLLPIPAPLDTDVSGTSSTAGNGVVDSERPDGNSVRLVAKRAIKKIAPTKSAPVQHSPAIMGALQAHSASLPASAPSGGQWTQPQRGETTTLTDKRPEIVPPVSKQSSENDRDIRATEPAQPAASDETFTTPPKVTYEDGQLTIIAENSRLSEVMTALHAATGADVELPASASGEHIWVRVGPGPARKVLDVLLSGTDLDFVIQGSATDADGIRNVILTARSEATPGTHEMANDAPEDLANRRLVRMNSGATDTPTHDFPVPAAPAAPPDAALQPASPQPLPLGTQSSSDEPVAHPAPPTSMTEGEISQELLSMYQKRKQMQQNPQAAPPAK